MELEIIVLYGLPWKFADSNTGEVKDGVSINYYVTTDLTPTPQEENGAVGIRAASDSISYELAEKITVAPACYKAKFKLTVDKKGQPINKIVDLDYICDISIKKMTETSPSYSYQTED